MALSEKLRQAQERVRRARELPAFLARVRTVTGMGVTEAALLDERRRAELAERATESQTRAVAQGTERRTLGLSRSEAEDFARRLGTLLADRQMIVGFGATPPALVPAELWAVLEALPAFVEVAGWFSAYTEDGASSLSVDLLMPGDYGNRHPQGSYEIVLRGPLFDGVDLPELYAPPARPDTARDRARSSTSGASPLGPDPGKLPG